MSAGAIGNLAIRYVTERTKRKELTGTTPVSYREILVLFARHVGWDYPIDRIRRRHVERWLEASALAPATMRIRLTVLHGFFDYAVERRWCRSNPTTRVRSPRRARTVPRALKAEQVSAALTLAPDARARLMILLMAQEGLRCQEVAGLEVGDLNLDQRVLLVRHGKGGHERMLPLSDETMGALQTYLGECPATSGPLIRSERRYRRRSISAQYVAQLVSGWLHEAGVQQTAHSLRHTTASDMLENGANLRNVQYALGHESLRSTERYLRWVVGDLREDMAGRRYRGADAGGLDRKPDKADQPSSPIPHEAK